MKALLQAWIKIKKYFKIVKFLAINQMTYKLLISLYKLIILINIFSHLENQILNLIRLIVFTLCNNQNIHLLKEIQMFLIKAL